MAKTTAPLFSFDARGKLAGALVYSGWKGIKTVRQYVIPANPNTSGQQFQRNFMSEAVTDWHFVGLTADDLAAWRRWAATLSSPMSGFNAFVRFELDARRAFTVGTFAPMLFNGAVSDSGSGQFDVEMEEDGGATDVKFFWGYSPTALFNELNPTEASNVWTSANVAATSGATVYVKGYSYDGSGNAIGASGLYTFGPIT